MTQAGIRELTTDELVQVSGGDLDWNEIGVGLGMIGLGLTIVATGGLALAPIGAFGALFAGEMLLAGTALGLAGGGGFLIGMGICW